MNPITSIRPLAVYEPQALVTPRLQPEGTNGIAPAELKELSPMVSPQPELRGTAAPGSFSNILGKLVEEVNTKQVQANASVQGLMAGQNVPLHQAMIAMEEASVSFQLMVEVRNRVLESYQELMRMQV